MMIKKLTMTSHKYKASVKMIINKNIISLNYKKSWLIKKIKINKIIKYGAHQYKML